MKTVSAERIAQFADTLKAHATQHIVYTQGFGTRKLAFEGTYRECMDWINPRKDAGDRTDYFMRVR